MAELNYENKAKKPMVYIAAPYTKPGPITNINRVVKVGMELWETGRFAVLVPHLNFAMNLVDPREESYWYEFDLDQLAHCDIMYRLDGYSWGADEEEKFAQIKNIPVVYTMEDLLAWADNWQG